jgi:Aspartyl protease
MAAPAVDVPMLFCGTRPAVHVRVNGEGPFLFLLDTGAAGAARLDSSLVKRLGLEPEGQREGSDAGAAGHAVLRQFHVNTLALGSFELRDVTAYSREYNTVSYVPQIDGILGIEFFAEVLLTLDYPARRVRMTSGHLPPVDRVSVLPLEFHEGNPYVPIKLGGLTATALIDTGNIRSIDMPSAAVAGLRQTSYSRMIGKGRSASGEFEIREMPVGDSLTIGRQTIPLRTVTFADEFTEINIGSAFLRRFIVTIDQRHSRFRLSR